jgi:MinD-like ATPase involved in chromosome partitioning or flagellar assembly
MSALTGGEPPKITIFAGHYGSGKTHLAVNYALSLRGAGKRAALVDLDIVNPYFRTSDAADILKGGDIDVIASAYAGSNVDIPAVPAETRRIIDDPSLYAVVDVGGDDRGALALGAYAKEFAAAGCRMYAVVNMYRPLSAEPEDATEIIRGVETASGLKFSGIINNSNLGRETTADHVRGSVRYAGAVAMMAGLPLAATAVREDLAEQLTGIPDLFPIRLLEKKEWRI